MDERATLHAQESQEGLARATSGALLPRARESRVLAIMRVMRDGRWVRGVTSAALAEKWGLSPSTTDQYANEAWRRVRAELEDRPAVQVHALAVLKDVARKSMQAAKSAENPGQERRVAVAAAAEMLKFAGNETFFPTGWESWAPQDKWRMVDGARARLEAIEATLPPRDVPELPAEASACGEDR
jgi:hypothetical protein